MELAVFCQKVGLPEEAAAQVLSMSLPEEVYEERKQIYMQDDEAFYDIILKEPNSKEWFLWYYCRMACESYEKYMDCGFTDEFYWTNYEDMRIWCEQCKEEHGVYGIAAYDWFWRFFKITILRFGRLQFEVIGAEYDMKERKFISIGDDAFISVHIPKGGPLIWEECEKSIEEAVKWFGKDIDYICHSWLMNPGLKELLSPESNIIKFQDHFELVKLDYNEREAEWRIFGTVERVVSAYPENTSLQKKAKEYLLSGKVFANGWSKLKF